MVVRAKLSRFERCKQEYKMKLTGMQGGAVYVSDTAHVVDRDALIEASSGIHSPAP